jgi:hypothetical protein
VHREAIGEYVTGFEAFTSIRTQSNPNIVESVYLCTAVNGDPERGHMMTSVGDTSGYVIVAVTPDQTFNQETTVSWDVSSAYLGNRTWFEVMIKPVGTPDLGCVYWVPCDLHHTQQFASYPPGAIVFGNGPFGGDVRYSIGPGNGNKLGDWCTIDPEGCNSLAIRRTWTIRENADGTITFTAYNRSWTVPGQFPPGEWEVVFKHHGYTQNKAEQPGAFIPGRYTLHWDSVVVR